MKQSISVCKGADLLKTLVNVVGQITVIFLTPKGLLYALLAVLFAGAATLRGHSCRVSCGLKNVWSHLIRILISSKKAVSS